MKIFRGQGFYKFHEGKFKTYIFFLKNKVFFKDQVKKM